MKRDMDLVYALLCEVENLPQGDRITDDTTILENRDRREVDYHVGLLLAAGLVRGYDSTSTGGTYSYWITQLTNAGHNFLDDVRGGRRPRMDDGAAVRELRGIRRQLGELERQIDRIDSRTRMTSWRQVRK